MNSLLRRGRNLSQRRVLREGGWVSANQLLSVLARLVGLRLLTELLAPSAYAEIVLLIGLATLGGNILCYPVLESAIRFYPDAVRAGRTATLRAMLSTLLNRRSPIVAGVLVVGGVVWSLSVDASPGVLAFALLGVFSLLDQRRAFEQSLLNASRRQGVWAAWNSVDAWARPLLGVAAILVLGAHAASVLLGYAVAVGAGSLFFSRYTVRPPPEEESDAVAQWREKTRAEIVRYSTPLIPLAVLGWIVSLSDRYLVAGLVSAQEAGIYAAAYGLASQPFITAASAFSITLRPIFNDAVARGDLRRERQVLGLWFAGTLAVLLAGLGLMVWLADWLVTWILGEAFWESAHFLPWVAATYVIQGLQHVLEAVIYSQRRTRRFLVVWLISSATALGLYLVLIPQYGAMGAAMGTLGAGCTTFVVLLVMSDIVPRLVQGRSLGAPDAAAASGGAPLA